MALADKIVIMKDGKIEQAGSPTEIYQKPISEFVAKFIGRANILDAKIISKNEDSTDIEILGEVYRIQENVKYNIDDNCKVVIRPESILFDGDKHNLKVTKSVFMGENHEYEVITDKGEILELSLNNPNGKKIANLQEDISFSFNESSIHIL